MSTHQEVVDGIARGLADAFNDADAAALAALFADDGEYVTMFGDRMRGRRGIERGHAVVFQRLLAGNRLVVSGADVRRLADDVLLAHVPWRRERRDEDGSPGLPPGTGIYTLVVRLVKDRWVLASATSVQHASPPSV